MAKITKLTAREVRRITKPGRYLDGGGLYLMVAKAGSKTWVQRIAINGIPRDKGLGSVKKVSIGQARTAAAANRDAVKSGRDPFDDRRKARMGTPTFAIAAADWYEAHRGEWSSGKHTTNIMAQLRNHALPVIGDMPVDEITVDDVQDVLRPIWVDKHETARRVKQRMHRVFRRCEALGLVKRNPVEVVDELLGKPRRNVRHMAALHHSGVADAILKIRSSDAMPVTKAAFEFLILTATRGGDVRHAAWHEFDIDAGLWTIPAERMKMRREHRIPLSDQALAILASKHLGGGDLVFETPQGKPLSENAFSDRRAKKGRTRMQATRFSVQFQRLGRRDQRRVVGRYRVVAGAQSRNGCGIRLLPDSPARRERRPLMQAWADYAI